MSIFKRNDVVRVLNENESSCNAYAIVRSVYENGEVWITNLNSPFYGTISDIVSPTEIELAE